MRKVRCFGLNLAAGDTSTICEALVKAAQGRLGGWILTLNLDMIARTFLSWPYADLAHSCSMATADGMPVVWSSRLAYPGSIPCRTTGIDIVRNVLSRRPPLRIAFIGGESHQQVLRSFNYPVNMSLVIDGPIPETEEFTRQTVARVMEFDAQIVFVSLHIPFQEKFCIRVHRDVPGAVVVGIGGALNYLSGSRRRAPVWMQNLGLEWLHKLLSYPGLFWKRYLLRYPVGSLALSLWVGWRLVARAFRRGKQIENEITSSTAYKD